MIRPYYKLHIYAYTVIKKGQQNLVILSLYKWVRQSRIKDFNLMKYLKGIDSRN
jgi:hypothetical protein